MSTVSPVLLHYLRQRPMSRRAESKFRRLLEEREIAELRYKTGFLLAARARDLEALQDLFPPLRAAAAAARKLDEKEWDPGPRVRAEAALRALRNLA